MYSDLFCKVYNVFGWNYYPEIFGRQLLQWLERKNCKPKSSLDLACGTGILCGILAQAGIRTAGMDLAEGMIRIARENDPQSRYYVADMVTFQPEECYDLVTCTGDAINHIPQLTDVKKIFQNVYGYLNPGGRFVFDLLNEGEVSSEEPFEMEDPQYGRIWFQMTRPADKQVQLHIKVFDRDKEQFQQIIREKLHDPGQICRLLRECGFTDITCENRLLPENTPGTTWFVTARKDEGYAIPQG